MVQNNLFQAFSLEEKITELSQADQVFLCTVSNEVAFTLIAYLDVDKRLETVIEEDSVGRPFKKHFLVFVSRTEYEKKQKEALNQKKEVELVQ